MKPTEYNFPTVVRHLYDIDAFEIIDSLKDKYKSNLDQVPEHQRDLEFIKLDEDLLIEFLKEEGIDFLEHQKHRNFIMPSYYNLYNTYLGYKLLTIDLYKIEPLLSYQSVLFLGNNYAPKENFLGLIEFLVYEFVKARLLPFEKIRLEKIVNWLERNRVFMLDKAYNDSESTIQNWNEIKENVELHNSEVESTTTLTENRESTLENSNEIKDNVEVNNSGEESTTTITENRESTLENRNEIKDNVEVNNSGEESTTTISENRESTLENSNEIKDNVEVNNSEKETTTTLTEHQLRVVKMEPSFANVLTEKLKCFFEGQEIQLFNLIIKNKSTEPLVFNGQANQLAELFKRLRYNSKISVATIDILANWIVKNFAIRNKQNEIEKLNYSTISQVLKKSNAEPPKGKRILEDIAKFSIPNLRKKDAEPEKKIKK